MTTRRNFLSRLLSIIPTIPFLGTIACRNNDEIDPDNELTSCETTEDILGPFYRADAPVRNNLNVHKTTGTVLNIEGTVYGDDCVTPLADVKIEIWHADDEGDYDNTSSDFAFRGAVSSEADGTYAFSTILPGRYLNGSSYRPSHIHFRVTAPDHEELVTQLYFEDDPFIATDPWASAKAAKNRIIALTEDADGHASGTFDIRLDALE